MNSSSLFIVYLVVNSLLVVYLLRLSEGELKPLLLSEGEFKPLLTYLEGHPATKNSFQHSHL